MARPIRVRTRAWAELAVRIAKDAAEPGGPIAKAVIGPISTVVDQFHKLDINRSTAEQLRTRIEDLDSACTDVHRHGSLNGDIDGQATVSYCEGVLAESAMVLDGFESRQHKRRPGRRLRLLMTADEDLQNLTRCLDRTTRAQATLDRRLRDANVHNARRNEAEVDRKLEKQAKMSQDLLQQLRVVKNLVLFDYWGRGVPLSRSR
ncbi:hypothetical protein EXIGLDRAFT_834644 [Exidia glandulosa HHB12029]|uniref:Uncharacterized protein n=1 Tax=Exidia glandulosa HHB12029 TaxID=1314781 RepID=A0A165JJT1_EXIGL|nr:hypothetical protein EXIGLDRAFT_834644 [Exidia glandulosa HHB12029]